MRAMSDRGRAHSVTEARDRGPGGREETWTVTTAASAQLPDVVPSVRSRWHEPLQRGLALAPDPTPTGAAAELTDPDGGEVTVGPYPAAVLEEARSAPARKAAPAAMRA